MKNILLIIAFSLFTAGSVGADDLYQVRLNSDADAVSLRATGVEPLALVDGYYLVLADGLSAGFLQKTNLDIKLIATGLMKDRLVMDGRIDEVNSKRFKVVYETPGVRILEIDTDMLASSERPEGLIPIHNEHLKIEYHDSRFLSQIAVETGPVLGSLVEAVSIDSLYAYVCSLQAYPYRAIGTANNLAARTWVYNKFVEFGYSDVELEAFNRFGTHFTNVIARKPGTLYPERQIVIGAHFDAVLASPGADDNGSGVAAVLEMARLLKDVKLPVTLIFIAFDAEEVGLYGSYAYVSDAVARGDHITFMQNMDMIGAVGNDSLANLYHGPEVGYALLWNQLAQTYSSIRGRPAGTSSRSDHYPFQLAGIDVCFSMEYKWSTVYHKPSDSTTYMNFDYMTRMVKACLATVYTAGRSPGVITPAALWQTGDGSTMQLDWHPADWSEARYYRVGYFATDTPAEVNYVTVPITDTTVSIKRLVEGREYGFFVQAGGQRGYKSVPYYRCKYGSPQSIPVKPAGLLAMPVRDGIKLTWNANNVELDLSHFEIFRDGELAGTSQDTSYIDLDPSLGTDFHSYTVRAVDTDLNCSDLAGPVLMRAAALDPNSILAINRTGNHTIDFVSAYETEVFIREALDGYEYTFYNDTLATKYPLEMPQLDLVDMLDHGVLVIGAESGKYDDIGIDPNFNGLLDTLAYYLSIGGKIVMFGRWGNVINYYDTTNYLTTWASFDDAYQNKFNIEYRVKTPTVWVFPYTYNPVNCDLIGAHRIADDYPELVWDSLLTMLHANAQDQAVVGTTGIPCASFARLTPGAEVIYTYDSRNDDPVSEGKPVAWRSVTPGAEYVWFEIPLSMFQRQSAVTALRKALTDIMGGGILADVEDKSGTGLPGSFALHQNFPNPFNPQTTIQYDLPRAADVSLVVYNLLGQKVRTLVDSYQDAGQKTVIWNGRTDSGEPVASGLYFYRLKTDELTQTKKMVMIK